MSTKFLRNLSFGEGFFVGVMLFSIAYYIFKVVQIPTVELWRKEGFAVVSCYLALCLIFDVIVSRSSKERSERMKLIAGIILMLIYLVSLGLAIFIFIVGTFSFWKLCLIMLISTVVFCVTLLAEGFCFSYEEQNDEQTDGLRANDS